MMRNKPREPADGGVTILDDAAILCLKRYIERKHPEFSSAQRAAVLANAVHRIVDRQLPDFEERTKIRLRQELLRQMGMQQRFTLLTGHILEACRELELEEDGMRQLAAWMERYRLQASWTAGFPQQEEWEQGQARGLQGQEQERGQEGQEQGGVRWPGLLRWASAAAGVLLLLAAGAPLPRQTDFAALSLQVSSGDGGAAVPDVRDHAGPETVLPNGYRYREVKRDKLQAWLQARKSLLADEPYLSAILAAAEEHDIHPLLLFAITGQEQAYVPKGGKKSKRIANNPFNVYTSWESYNTNIADSARIASRTILTISRDRPEEAHPVQWLNTRYAEDPNWWVGVSSIFEKLKKEIGEAGE